MRGGVDRQPLCHGHRASLEELGRTKGLIVTEYMTGYDAESVAWLHSRLADIYRASAPWVAVQEAVKEIRRLDWIVQELSSARDGQRPMAQIGNFVVNYLPPGARIEHVEAEGTVEESWAIHIPSNPLRLRGVWGDTLAEAIATYWQIAEEGGAADD